MSKLPVARVVKMPPPRALPPAPVVEPISYEAVNTGENVGIYASVTSTENIGLCPDIDGRRRHV